MVLNLCMTLQRTPTEFAATTLWRDFVLLMAAAGRYPPGPFGAWQQNDRIMSWMQNFGRKAPKPWSETAITARKPRRKFRTEAETMALFEGITRAMGGVVKRG